VALSDDLFWLGGYFFFFFSRPISFSDVHRRAARGYVKGGSSLARVCVCDIDSEILRSDGLAHSKGTVDLNISFL
jgi:hypothetical protein